jgi:hypothetical protein
MLTANFTCTLVINELARLHIGFIRFKLRSEVNRQSQKLYLLADWLYEQHVSF